MREKTTNNTFASLEIVLAAVCAVVFSAFPGNASASAGFEIEKYYYDDEQLLTVQIKNTSTEVDTLYYLGINDSSPSVLFWSYDIISGIGCSVVTANHLTIDGQASCLVHIVEIQKTDGGTTDYPAHTPSPVTKSEVDAFLGTDALETLYTTINRFYSQNSDAWSSSVSCDAFPFGGVTGAFFWSISPVYPVEGATSTSQWAYTYQDAGKINIHGEYTMDIGDDCVLLYTDGTGSWFGSLSQWGWRIKATEQESGRIFTTYEALNGYACESGYGELYDKYIYLPDGSYLITYEAIQSVYSTSTNRYTYTYYDPEPLPATTTLLVDGSRYAGGDTTTTVPVVPDSADYGIVGEWISGQFQNINQELQHRFPLNYIYPVLTFAQSFKVPTSTEKISVDLGFGTSPDASVSTTLDLSSGFASSAADWTIGETTMTPTEWFHMISRLTIFFGLISMFWKFLNWLVAPQKTAEAVDFKIK